MSGNIAPVQGQVRQAPGQTAQYPVLKGCLTLVVLLGLCMAGVAAYLLFTCQAFC